MNNDIIEIIQIPTMKWISVKDHEIPLSTDILVKWDTGDSKGKAFISAIKQKIDNEVMTFFYFHGINGYQSDADFAFEAKDITHYMVIDD